MRQHFLSITWCLVVCCAVVMGCGGAEHAAQIEKQAKEIERLQIQLRDADGRLEVASKQLHAATEHAERLDRSLEASKKECDAVKQQAAQDVRALQGKCDVVAGELAVAQKRLSELDRKDRVATVKLSPEGTWALDGKIAHRFLFFANGTGVFQHWDSEGGRWLEGDPEVYGKPRSDGKFMFRRSGAEGTYDLRFTRRRPTTQTVKSYPGDLTPTFVDKIEETIVDVTVVMNAADATRLVGWQAADTVMRRVDESWTPKDKAK